MTINVIHSWKDQPGQDEILKQLSLILKQNTKIMALIDDLTAQVADLNTKVDTLQSTVDSEQQAIADLLAINAQVVTDLNAQIAALNEQIANGATPAQLTAISTELATIAAKVDAASTDVAGTV